MLCFITDDNQFYIDRFVESYKQYCSGFDLTIVAGDEHAIHTPEQVYVDSKYMALTNIFERLNNRKLLSPGLSSRKFVAITHADYLFTRPLDPSKLLNNKTGKPKLFCESYVSLCRKLGFTHPVFHNQYLTENILKFKVSHEFCRLLPMMYDHQSLSDAVSSAFSSASYNFEFHNVIGAYLSEKYPLEIDLVDLGLNPSCLEIFAAKS